ncbi:hypothetical protein A5777_03290 [Gordonia sp. 852002-10350_SCH5691597]|nr:hypothetical protein A5777_03290 [Gordonia sp. 852002-10350_SCH5691597]
MVINKEHLEFALHGCRMSDHAASRAIDRSPGRDLRGGASTRDRGRHLPGDVKVETNEWAVRFRARP